MMNFKKTKHQRALKLGLFIPALILASCWDSEVRQAGPRFDLDGRPVSDGASSAYAEALSLDPVSRSDWGQHMGNTQHHAPNAGISTLPQLSAKVNLGIGSRKAVLGASAPIIVGGRVFHYDSDGVLHGLTAGGGRIWSKSLIPPGELRGDGFGGGLAYAGGRIYVATGYGEVLAVDANNGDIYWRYKQSSPLRKAPLVIDNKVIFTVEGSQTVALSATTGVQLWRQYSAQSFQPSRLRGGVPSGQGSDIVTGYSSGELQRLTTNGSIIWSIDNIADYFTGSKSLIGDVSADPVIIGGNVIAGTNSGIASVSMDSGQVNWVNNIGSKGPLIVSGNSVFGIGEDERIFRLSLHTGQTQWARALPPSANPGNIFARKFNYLDVRLVNNEIWVIEKQGILRRYAAANGALLSESEIPQLAAPPVFGNGLMVAVSKRGEILIFR